LTAVPASLTLERPGATLAYERLGSGPALLLLHATLASSREMRPLARLLAPRFSVVSVDRRGSGQSHLRERPQGAVDVADHVDDLVELIGSLDLGPVAVVGHSYGGCLALELAARQPELVDWAWVYEPPYAQVGADEVRARLLDVGRVTAEAAASGGPPAAALAFYAGVSGSEAAAALSTTARERIMGEGTGAIADASLRGFEPDGLARIVCPVAVATGSNGAVFYSQIADALVDRIATARRVRLDGVDHLAPILDARTIARAVAGFART